MRSSTILPSLLAILSATACTISHQPADRPEPVAARRVEPVARRSSTAATLGIPPGHLPKPGKCRVWHPGEPPGHQPPPRSCAGIDRTAPAGSWILYRPGRDRKVVHVRVVDRRRPGVVILLRVYDADGGHLLREEDA